MSLNWPDVKSLWGFEFLKDAYGIRKIIAGFPVFSIATSPTARHLANSGQLQTFAAG
jgi:hypothetical protein